MKLHLYSICLLWNVSHILEKLCEIMYRMCVGINFGPVPSKDN